MIENIWFIAAFWMGLALLATVVILSAFVPTLIAQRFFQPRIQTMKAWGRLYRRKIDRRPPVPT